MDGGSEDDAPSDRPVAPGASADDADRWLAEQRVDDAIGARRRAADLREQAAQEGTLRGVLIDLAERGRPLVLRTVAGVEHRVVLTSVGTDVVTGRTARGEHVAVSLDGVATVRVEPGAVASIGDRATDDRAGAASMSLSGHVQELAAVRPEVVAHLRDGSTVSGTLTTAGADLVAVRRRDGDRSTVHVALGALGDLVVLDATELP